jgi:hypothetical protein
MHFLEFINLIGNEPINLSIIPYLILDFGFIPDVSLVVEQGAKLFSRFKFITTDDGNGNEIYIFASKKFPNLTNLEMEDAAKLILGDEFCSFEQYLQYRFMVQSNNFSI